MSTLTESIFREYDIRGIAETELGDEAVGRIAAAAATIFLRENKTRIAIGMDGRPSSERIRAGVIRTLLDHGLEVLDIGLVPTPLVYYAVFRFNLDGGLIITASHNPPEYNGIKAMIGKSALFGDGIKELYRIVVAGRFPPRRQGKLECRDIIPDYLEYVRSNIRLEKKIRVVVDGGNGTGGLTAGPLYRALGAEVSEIFCDVDGRFPNHHPDPTRPENLQQLIAKVKETRADLGIGLDGDADRIGVVTGAGDILLGDQLLLVFARDVLARLPGSKIISEVKASEVLYADIRQHGGIPIMWKTGHSLLKQKIQEEKAPLAGEVSGHMFFNDKWFGFDDAVYAGARLLEILSRRTESLADIVATIPKIFNTPELRVDASDEAKFPIVEEICRLFKKKYPVIDIDGARIRFPHGWALVRASNTQPALVIRYEADTAKHLRQIRDEVETTLERVRAAIGG